MKVKFYLLALLAYMFIHAGIFCQEPYILYICDSTNDSGFTDILENAGYDVVRITGEYSGTLNPGELDYANNASLIIISRNCYSLDYGGTEELAAQWNGIRAPILNLSAFSTRNNRWQWFNSASITCEGDTITIPASATSHPVYEGIETSEKQKIYAGIGSDFMVGTDAGNGKVLAYNIDETGIFIAEWNAGIPFYDGATYTPAARRVFFAAGESDCGASAGQDMSAYNLNETGKTMFLNMVSYLIPAATFYKFPDGSAPVIDGRVDPLWSYVDAYAIKLYDQYNRVPTFDLVTWRAAWNDTCIFVIISVDDDDFYPYYEAGSTINWEYDKPEVYFDINAGELDDGLGPVTLNSGHIQIAEPFYENLNPLITELITWSGYKITLGYHVNDPDYIYEYAVDISYLLDKYSDVFDPSAEPVIGFDVNIIDRDEGDDGKRTAVWMNTGENGMSWDNMDDCGEVAFSNSAVDKPDATFYRFPDGCAPVIDGTVDPLWGNVEAHHINRTYRTEQPTFDLATWQAAWNDTCIFVLVTVEDDDFCPPWESGDYDWMSDKPEIYLDINNELHDGGGPADGEGHFQLAPSFIEGADNNITSGNINFAANRSFYATYAYDINGTDYKYEYAISINSLRNNNGNILNPYTIDYIGFDVTVIDRDAADNGRRRAVWKNTGALDESWNNMDDCGIVIFNTNEVAVDIGASISADKYAICRGEQLQLRAVNTSCNETALSYSWESVPAGFSSAVSNPVVSPAVTTLYRVDVSDGTNSGSASVNITVKSTPEKSEIRLKGENILICIDSGLYSYQWYYNDELITGETKQFCQVNPNYSGNYYVQTGYENQCTTMSDPFNFASKSGTLKAGEPFIEIYPVPNTGNFTLNMTGDESGRVLINIRDYSGTIIRNLVIDKGAEPLSEEISIINMHKGIYILDILFNNLTYYRKLVIN